MADNKLEAACALAFAASMREQGTHMRTANASELSIAFHYAAQAVADQVRERDPVASDRFTEVYCATRRTWVPAIPLPFYEGAYTRLLRFIRILPQLPEPKPCCPCCHGVVAQATGKTP